MNTSAEIKDRLFDIDGIMNMPWYAKLCFVGTIIFALWHLATNLILHEPGRWQNAIHFAGFAFLAAADASEEAVWSWSSVARDAMAVICLATTGIFHK